MPRHVMSPESEGVRLHSRASTLWWSSPDATEKKRRSFVIAAPALDVTKGLRLTDAVDVILQDAVARYRVAQGCNVAYTPWLDHGGMLAQYTADLDVQARSGEPGLRRDFDHLTRKWQRRQRRHAIEMMRKLGVHEVALDLDSDTDQAALGTQLFAELFDRGWVYRDQALLCFCHHCGRSVGEREIRPERARATARVFRCAVDGFGEVDLATLHPELILGAIAVAAVPGDLHTMAMVGSDVTLPVTGRRVPVIEVPHREGGLARTLSLVVPAFNALDFEYARHQDLPIPPLLALDETIDESIDNFAGLPLEAARDRILEIARSEGSLSGRFTHHTVQPIHTACGSELRPRVEHVWLVRGRDLGNAADQLMVESSSKFNHPAWQYSYRRKISASTRPPAATDVWWEGAPAASFQTLASASDPIISERSCVGPAIPAAHCRSCQITVVAADLPSTCNGCGGALEHDPDVLNASFGSALWTIALAAQHSDTAKVDCAVLGRDLLESWIPTAELVAQSLYGHTAIKHMLVHGAVVEHPPSSHPPPHGHNGHNGAHDGLLEAALKRWDGDAIRAAVFTAMADHEGAQEVGLDAGSLEQGAHMARSIREGLAAIVVGEVNDIQYGAQLARVEREVARAMDSYHLGWAYRLVSSFITKRLHTATHLSPARFDTLLSLLQPFHPQIVASASASLVT